MKKIKLTIIITLLSYNSIAIVSFDSIQSIISNIQNTLQNVSNIKTISQQSEIMIKLIEDLICTKYDFEFYFNINSNQYNINNCFISASYNIIDLEYNSIMLEFTNYGINNLMTDHSEAEGGDSPQKKLGELFQRTENLISNMNSMISTKRQAMSSSIMRKQEAKKMSIFINI